MKTNESTYKEAVRALEACAKSSGFYASGLKGGYEATWARDSMITSLGASLARNKFRITFQKSLALLRKNQSLHGQIPNAVGSYNLERGSNITFNSIDSSLWYIIGNYAYAKSYKDKTWIKKNQISIHKALTWVQYQDPNEDTLPVQQPTMDWQDAFPHKYGRTINTEALYFTVLNLSGDKKLARHLKNVVNGETEKYLSLYSNTRGYYLPWVWKTHGPKIREEEYWFDTLGNLLAIVTGLAKPVISKKILNYIERNKINRPYPCKAIFPPIKRGDKEWKKYFDESESRTPYEYLNGGIWPFIGGFYVAALVKAKQFKKAGRELEKLAEANKISGDKRVKEYGFHEWLHGKTGKPKGGSSAYQAWSAGMYIYAYECVKQKRVLFF